LVRQKSSVLSFQLLKHMNGGWKITSAKQHLWVKI